MITLRINQREVSVEEGSTVATAVMAADPHRFRRSLSGEDRFPLCGMGICFECRVKIDGAAHQRSCQILAQNGMDIETDD